MLHAVDIQEEACLQYCLQACRGAKIKGDVQCRPTRGQQSVWLLAWGEALPDVAIV